MKRFLPMVLLLISCYCSNGDVQVGHDILSEGVIDFYTQLEDTHFGGEEGMDVVIDNETWDVVDLHDNHGADFAEGDWECIPDCNLKCNGASDGCGGTCSSSCPSGYSCNAEKKICDKISEPRCGDFKCNSNESACTCPSDCSPLCGDGCCSVGENKGSCPNDCLVDCLKLSYSTYNLLYLGYSESQVAHFVKNAANAGSEFIRIMALMDCECSRGAKEWVFGPWKRREPAPGECGSYNWPYWNLNEWNEEYFKRLDFIVNLAKQNNMKVLLSIFAIQENPLQYIGPENILNKLSQFIDELKRRGFDQKITDWEIDNEGGTGLFSHESEENSDIIYFEYTTKLANKIRATLGGTLYHSGTAPGLLAPIYDVYMPHLWLGPNPIESLAENGFESSSGIEYVEHLRKDYGKSILPSSDGGMPDLCNDDAIKALLLKTYQLNWIGLEIDIGWYTSPDGKCWKWGENTPNTGRIEDVEWNLAHRVSEIAEQLFVGCKYVRGGIVPFVNNRLNPNEYLSPNQTRISENGRYKLIFQGDCNLVLVDTINNVALWTSQTENKCSPRWAIMQSDGNFVIYDVNNKAIWASNTDNNPNAYLLVRDDGRIAIVNASGNVVWIRP
ncbi:MAG: hypothetical protein N2746_12245 [Deltaproteobacteria bacterium]|nr:hypothetical protein [Deltaproteobacteria bacterium]